MKIKWKELWKLLLLLPFVLGTVGLLKAGAPTLADAMYESTQYYVLNGDMEAANFWIQIARWMAPVMTMSGVFLLAKSVREKLRGRLARLGGESTAVYGDLPNVDKLLKELGPRGIRGEEGKLVNADRYLVLYEDEEKNLNFYNQYEVKLRDKKVYLKCETLRPQIIENPNIHLFGLEDSFARCYWQDSRVLEECTEKQYQYKIVLIGFGTLGERLLVRALQNNIFSAEQRIEYHIFGESEKFQRLHHELHQITMDQIIFHSEPWYEKLPLMEAADRVLLTDANMDNLSVLNDLSISCRVPKIDVLNGDNELLNLFFPSENVTIYEFESEVCSFSNIVEEQLLEEAKQLNLQYAVLNGGACADEETKEKQWRELDAFTRYSNISSVDYHKVRMKLLERWKSEEPATEHLERLSELEHIRWCRYHFLNNWTYGVPESGKAKDATKRIHVDLIPYSELSEGEKQKDRETIQMMMNHEC